MRILILCYEYPPIGGGGAKVVHGLIKQLIYFGHEVDLITMRYKKLPLFEKLGNLNIYRINCLRLRANICSPFEMISYVIAAIPLVFRLCRKNKYDINHTHFIYPDGILAYLIKLLTNQPYVITAHGSDVPGYNPDRFKFLHKILTPLWQLLITNANQIVAPSLALEQLVRKVNLKVKSTIIPNGIDLDKFSPHKNRENKILVVTRMFERKGVQYFLQALPGLNHNSIINIVGEGPYLETLKKLASGIDVKINFLGYLENGSKELSDLYESSKIFVFTSEAENFPVVLLEAMIAGLAIITTNGTGCAEVVGNGAILVKAKDSAAIKNALVRLTDDPALCTQLGKIARSRAEELFGWETVTKKYLQVYSRYSIHNQEENYDKDLLHMY